MDHNTKNHEIWTSRGPRIIFSEKKSLELHPMTLAHMTYYVSIGLRMVLHGVVAEYWLQLHFRNTILHKLQKLNQDLLTQSNKCVFIVMRSTSSNCLYTRTAGSGDSQR